MIDSAFNLNTVLRFVLPGAVCGLAMVLVLDLIFLTSDSSLLRIVHHSSFAVGFTLALIPASFAFGVILNALTFQRGYHLLSKFFAKHRPSILKLEDLLYNSILNQTVRQYASKLDAEDRRCLEEVLWRNKRGAFMAGLNNDILQRLDDQYSPYADFQLGLAIAIFLLYIVTLPWLAIMNYHALHNINRCLTIAALSLFSGIIIFILLHGAYSNYIKLREMKLVMVICLAGSEQNV